MEIVFNGTSGLNNVVDPAHIPVGEAKIIPLASCLNVVVEDTGRLSRLEGTILIVAANGD